MTDGFHGEYQNEYIDVIDLKSGTFTRNNGSADVHLYDNVVNDITYLTGWLNKITVTDDGLFCSSPPGEAHQSCTTGLWQRQNQKRSQGKAKFWTILYKTILFT